MATRIERSAPVNPGSVAFAASVGSSDTICMANSAAFAFVCPPSATSTTVSWYAASTDAGPYYPVILPSGSAASTAVVAGRVYIAPPELYACTYVRGVAASPFSAVVMLKT